MNQVLRDKLERWLQSAPADPLTHVIEGDVPLQAQSPALRKALSVLDEARRAFAAAKRIYLEASAASAAAQGTPLPDLATMRSARATMSEAGHAILGHYVAVIDAALAVGPLVATDLAADRRKKDAELDALTARLTKALLDLGFAPGGTQWPLLFNSDGSHNAISVAKFVENHPQIVPFWSLRLGLGAYGGPRVYEVSGAANKAVKEAAALLMELEED